MRGIVQRVASASVTVDGEVIGAIDRGILLLLGIGHNDTVDDAAALGGKITRLRIFPDDRGVPQVSLLDVGGSVLVISQFTIMGNTRKGNRPSFTEAAPAELAEGLYDRFVGILTELLGAERVATGQFGADMKVTLTNDGPYTIVLDTAATAP